MLKNLCRIMACTLLFALCVQAATALAPNKPIEAREYDAVASQKAAAVVNTSNAADETSLGGTFAAGDCLAYKDLDFGAGGYKKFMLVLAANAANAGKKIEIRLDSPAGTKLGEITLSDTKGSTIFKEHYVDIAATTGVHDLYLVFPAEVDVDLDFFLFTTYLFTPYAGTDNGVYYNTGGLAITETPEEKAARMKWWNDARYGMFIHFGAYSYLGGRTLNSTTGAFTGTVMTSGVEWIMRRMAPADAFPKDIYREYCSAAFNPKDFNAKEIVQLAKDAGMNYITITTRHHEGFSMYDTKIRDFKDYKITQTANHGNFDRDIVKELADECRAQGVHFATYLTLVDWYDRTMYPIYGTQGGFNASDKTAGFNGSTVEARSVNKADYLSRLKGQLKELIVDYGAKSIWFDCGGMFALTHDESYEIYHYLRSLNPEIISNNRIFTDRIGTTRTATDQDFFTPEGSALSGKADFNFELCLTLNNNWGYAMNDNNWKSPATVMDYLLRSAGYGGNLLLNVGPDGDGQVPSRSSEILRDVGGWLKKNGNSIYGTVPAFYETSELPGGVYTTAKEGKLFIHLTPNYTMSTIMLDALENTITGAITLNDKQPVTPYSVSGKLFIDLSGISRDPYNTVLEISVDGGMPKRKSTGSTEPGTNIAKDMNDKGKLTLTGSNTYRRSAETAIDPKDPDLTFGYKKAVDGSDVQVGGSDSRWATSDEVTAAELILTFTEPVTVNKAVVQAFAQGTQGGTGNNTNWIRALNIEYWDGANWVVAAGHSGAYLGNKEKKEFVFETFTTTKVRLDILEAYRPSIWEFQLFYDPGNINYALNITSPTRDAQIPKGDFTISGAYTGDAEAIEIKLSAKELAIPLTVQGTLDTGENTWSSTVQAAEMGLPQYVENLSILAFLKKGSDYVAVDVTQAVYGGYDNLVLNSTVTASSSATAYGPEQAIDGIHSDPANRWMPLDTDVAPSLTVDLEEAGAFSKAIIYEYKGNAGDGLPNGYRATAFKIEYDPGDGNWLPAYTGGQIGDKGEYMLRNPVTAKRVKLELTGFPNTGFPPGIHEFELYLVPVDFTKLRKAVQEAIADIGTVELDNLYTAESLNIYLAAMETAQKILDKQAPYDDPAQGEVDDALNTLLEAIAKLTSPGSKTPVINAAKPNISAGYSASPYNVSALFTVDKDAGTPTYTLETGGTGAGTLAGNLLSVTRPGTFDISLVTAETATHAAGAKVTAMLTVNKIAQAAPAYLTGNKPASGNNGSITGLLTDRRYEYRKYNAPNYTATSAGATQITGLSAGVYMVRVTESDLYAASPIAEVYVCDAPPFELVPNLLMPNGTWADGWTANSMASVVDACQIPAPAGLVWKIANGSVSSPVVTTGTTPTDNWRFYDSNEGNYYSDGTGKAPASGYPVGNGSRIAITNDVNASYELSFTGSGVALFTQYYNTNSFTADVYLNGDKVTEVNCVNSSGRDYQRKFFDSAAEGIVLDGSKSHTVRVVCTGPSPSTANATNRRFRLDAFCVYPAGGFNSLDEIFVSREKSVTLYPNPVKAGQAFSIKFDGERADATLGVYTVSGVKIAEWQTNGDDTGRIIHQPGLYIIEVKKNTERWVLKVVVN